MEGYAFDPNSNQAYEKKQVITRNGSRQNYIGENSYGLSPIKRLNREIKADITQEHTYAKTNVSEVCNGFEQIPTTSRSIDVVAAKLPYLNGRSQGKRIVKAPTRFTEDNDNKQGELKVQRIEVVKETSEMSSSSSDDSDSSEYEEDSDSDNGQSRRKMRKRKFHREHFPVEEDEDEPIEIQQIEEAPPKPKKIPLQNFHHQMLKCSVCDREVVMRSNARTSKITNALTHAKMHLTRRQFECSVCRYQSNTHIQRHVQTIHKGKAKVIDKMNDELRRLYRDMTIRCFPHLYREIHSWYRQSSDLTRAGGRKSKNMIKLEREDDCEIEC